MPLIPATQLRAGMTIQHENALWRVMAVTHVTPGNWRGMVQTKLRNLKTGTQTEHRFRSEDRVDRATLEQHEMEFLYDSDGHYHFMNTETYEQIAFDRDTLGDAVNYLTPNSRIEVEFFETTPDRREPAEDRRPEGRRDHPGHEDRHRHQRAQARHARDRPRRAGARLHQRGRPAPRRHRDRRYVSRAKE